MSADRTAPTSSGLRLKSCDASLWILPAHATQSSGAERAQQVSLDETVTIHWNRSAEFVALDEAISSLAEIDRRKSQVVELRFFGGLTAKATAEVLKVSQRTVEREWNLARAWLYRELRGEDEA